MRISLSNQVKSFLAPVLFALALLPSSLFAQHVAKDVLPINYYADDFAAAYLQYPEIPKGILEAVSYNMTHFRNIPSNETASCTGLPAVVGVMGMMPDGKGWFRENLHTVSNLSGVSIKTMLSHPREEIMAYAKAYNFILSTHHYPTKIEEQVPILEALSELPEAENGGSSGNFVMFSRIYKLFSFLNDAQMQQAYGLPVRTIAMEKVFGAENLNVLSSSHIAVSKAGVTSKKGGAWKPLAVKSVQYGPAIWNPAPSCNYSSRSGTPVSAITIHTIQGSYSGAISWALNCNSNVSYHYVIRSSDGQISQLVDEADKAWHVGSENPYTIGYEHEGYVSDPSWYTTAMYNASADLSRDVTQSGYGINPLRTYYGPSSSGGNTLGGCTKIKGHQHYPNQTHTDPGINWDWERYYKLINNTPNITTENGVSGTWYDSGGAGFNYTDDERLLTLIQPAGATNVTVTFTAFDLETNWDYLYIYDGPTTNDALIGVFTGTNSPGVVTSSGGALLFDFRSDCATTNPGWAANWTSNGNTNPFDNTPPTTLVSIPSTWATADFQTTFTDADEMGGSGLAQRFYQVIDYDGTEWRANSSNGFFSDNFDVNVHADWTSALGTWSISNNTLLQSDQALTNSNLYAALNQNNDDQWLYHWAGKIDGTGINRRAGFHFMCDDGSLTNRGNSYFVWFRMDDNKIQIYETVNDVFQLEVDLPFTFTAGQWYDYKVSYDKLTGTIKVFVDNSMEASWIDATPLTVGNAISFRSGECAYNCENLKVYHSRPSNVTVSVGAANTNDLRFQNPSPVVPSGKIKSLVLDSADNLSNITQRFVNVDWTAPSTIAWIADGPNNDIDTVYSNTELEANWSFSLDAESDLARYYYALGTSSGATDVIAWTDHWTNDTLVQSGLNLTYGQTYFFSVKSENGAGLQSPVVSSDGVFVAQPTAPPTAGFNYNSTYLCSGDAVVFTNNSSNALSYDWTFQNGTPAASTDVNPSVVFPTTGSYNVTLIATGPGGVDTINQILTVNILPPPTAGFTVADDTVWMPSPIAYFTNTSNDANGYSWDFGDGTGSTDVDPWHQYTAVGTYNVSLSAINGVCPDDTVSATVVVAMVDGMSVNDLIQNVLVFPNPAPADAVQLQIELKNGGRTEIEITDASGKSVWKASKNLPQGSILLQPKLGEIAAGYYTVRIVHANSMLAVPLLIEE